jgi:hypothetical protein
MFKDHQQTYSRINEVLPNLCNQTKAPNSGKERQYPALEIREERRSHWPFSQCKGTGYNQKLRNRKRETHLHFTVPYQYQHHTDLCQPVYNSPPCSTYHVQPPLPTPYLLSELCKNGSRKRSSTPVFEEAMTGN